MTIAEQIIKAVAYIVSQNKEVIFTRKDIQKRIGISPQDWKASYSPVFQGMRIDQPGGAPDVIAKYKNVFRQVERGKHTLTEQGRKIITGFGVKFCPHCLKAL